MSNKFLNFIFGVSQAEKNVVLAFFLGFSGAIPFVFFTILFLNDYNLYLEPVVLLRSYSEIILSFLGAVHWGFFISEKEKNIYRLVWSVIPSLIAFFSTFFSNIVGFLILTTGFFLSYLLDKKYFRASDCHWYLLLRLRLTIIVTFCLLLTLEKLVNVNS